MADRDDVRELLGSYVLGHLEGDVLARVEAALARDGELRREADELRAVAELLPLVDPDDLEVAGPPPAGLEDEVVSELRAGDAGAGERIGAGEVLPGPGGRRAGATAPGARRWLVPAAAVLVVAVIGIGIAVQGADPDPGLGVEEPIAFEVVDETIDVEASLVPHTWGTEVFLTMNGLADGEVYLVELEGTDGELVSAGTFLGDADLEVVCVMNGALVREDVGAVRITTEDGQPVMRAELDDVGYRSV